MDKIQTIKERIFIFLENRGIKKETFYKETGMSSSNFKGAGLKSDLGVDKLAKIVNVYPELKDNENLNWLITGHGKLNLIQIRKKNSKEWMFIVKKSMKSWVICLLTYLHNIILRIKVSYLSRVNFQGWKKI